MEEESEMDSNLPRKKSKKIRLLLGILLLVLVFLCAYLAAAGYFSLWIDGMRYVVYDLNRYAYTYEAIEETEPFTISLRDPDSNKGMVVYDGGTCRIEVSGVDAQDGHYRIHFRSYGNYDIDGATLISARKHDIRRGRISSAGDLEAALVCVADDHSYSCKVAGTAGVYKNGDSFSFHIPDEAVTEQTETLTLVFHHLIRNRWYEP